MTAVRLNEAEMRLVNYLANRWQAVNLISKKKNMKRSPEADYEIARQGIAAEMAFCKLAKVYYEPRVEAGKLPNEDVKLITGHSVDVKATKYENGKLLVAPWKANKRADLYVLMVGKAPSFRFAGMASADEVFKTDNLKNVGYGQNYTLEQSELSAPQF